MYTYIHIYIYTYLHIHIYIQCLALVGPSQLKDQATELKDRAKALTKKPQVTAAPHFFEAVKQYNSATAVTQLAQKDLTSEHFKKPFLITSGECIDAWLDTLG